MADNVELVRQLWVAFERGGIEAVLEIADPDVEWEPYGGGGEVYRGHAGLREYMESRRSRDEEPDARLYSAFAKGDAVVARGEVQIRSKSGVVTMQPGWLYEFRSGKLVRFRGFPTQDAALRAAGFAPHDPPAIVREIWEAFNHRQVDRALGLIADDCEWRPYNGVRDLYVGPAGVREYYEETVEGIESGTAFEYTVREVGDLLAVSGSLHEVGTGGAVTQRQVHWVYRVNDGKVDFAQSFARREDALAAADARRG